MDEADDRTCVWADGITACGDQFGEWEICPGGIRAGEDCEAGGWAGAGGEGAALV